MVTLAQRIEALRTERGLSRPALAAELGFTRLAIEKFETGRQTPSKDQQEKLANYFGVSLFYLRGESNDRTRMETWMDGAYDEEEPSYQPAPAPKRTPKAHPAAQEGGMMDALLASRQVQELLQKIVLDTLRSPEGQQLITNIVLKELQKRQ